ncbi:hypothetical protein [Acinetobacter soli]|uniref:Uncharacterized protein n=1 Tax=Acinetobacter soli TaxID=487316 RepID=A0AB38YTT6_9GAMM|nr:hypothetical protein [Acinetobacter soli]KQC98598.1 hypothetical protein APD01_09810 [Acinetobacter soli]MDQ8941328.1 hypothetical protein [Acinetobacter soli]WEH92934.1 hypothetical protein PYR75_07035 [Acinetobacter soli]WEH97876.1 hypothetical protein PYR76_17025 [Acinetobacter soli]WEI01554.1 hypothetical protein PYR77_06630 [Acinetobacter soli]
MTVKVSIRRILSENFFQNNTTFENLDDLFSKAGITIFSLEGDKALSENKYFNLFIKNNTLYRDFNDMKGKAITFSMFQNLR